MNVGTYNESEIKMLAYKEDTITDTSNGLEIWHSGYHPIFKNKYIIVIKNGLCQKNGGLNPNIIGCKISLEDSSYITHDQNQYLTQEEKDWAVAQINNNWDLIKSYFNECMDKMKGIKIDDIADQDIILYEGVTPFKESDTPPDYTSLPVKGE